MLATANRQPEGALIYIMDKSDLYVRVRDGVRQVMVRFFGLSEITRLQFIRMNTEQHFIHFIFFYEKSCFLPARESYPFLQRFSK